MKAHKVTIYTDGACKGNPGPSGWAYHISMTNDPNKYAIKSGSILEGTNNIAELTAEKRYEKVKEALDKEAALRIEAEAKAEELRLLQGSYLNLPDTVRYIKHFLMKIGIQ